MVRSSSATVGRRRVAAREPRYRRLEGSVPLPRSPPHRCWLGTPDIYELCSLPSSPLRFGVEFRAFSPAPPHPRTTTRLSRRGRIGQEVRDCATPQKAIWFARNASRAKFCRTSTIPCAVCVWSLSLPTRTHLPVWHFVNLQTARVLMAASCWFASPGVTDSDACCGRGIGRVLAAQSLGIRQHCSFRNLAWSFVRTLCDSLGSEAPFGGVFSVACGFIRHR